MKTRLSALGMILTVTLVVGSIPVPARAGSGPAEETLIRLRASERFGPIGTLMTMSVSGSIAIDNRLARGEEPLWGGELITALKDARAGITLGSIGRATLEPGCSARFATARAESKDSSYEVLVASLLTGRVNIKLDALAGAYIEAAGSIVTASPGADFSVLVDDGRAAVRTVAGNVRVQNPAVPQDVNIKIVDELGRPVSSGSQLSVRARSTRQIHVQVTDQNDKPLPDLPVLFSLGSPCLGSLGLGVAAGSSFRQKTDNRGIAAVPFIAGAARCAGSIVAKVEGTNASVSLETSVSQSQGFWTTQNTLLVVAAAAEQE